jgi:dTDP-4-dehydrorhamnose 3,5-epimerase
VSGRFEIRETPLPGLMLIKRQPIGDSRGHLDRLFCAHDLQELIPGKGIAQVNCTLTARRGTVRGLHAQRPPHAETKFVACLRGEVFDAAVDIRRGSPTFLRWHAEILRAGDHTTMLIPEGFAHGFQTLTDDCELLYLHTAAYHPAAECCLNARDPRLGIRWPGAIAELSPRDAGHPLLAADFSGVVV